MSIKTEKTYILFCCTLFEKKLSICSLLVFFVYFQLSVKYGMCWGWDETELGGKKRNKKNNKQRQSLQKKGRLPLLLLVISVQNALYATLYVHYCFYFILFSSIICFIYTICTFFSAFYNAQHTQRIPDIRTYYQLVIQYHIYFWVCLLQKHRIV